MTPTIRDTTRIHDSQDLMAKPAPAFLLTGLEVDELEPTRVVVLWRTSVYADGTALLRGGDDEGMPVVLEEPGAKRRNHALVIVDLTPDTHYEIAVISADADGHTVDGGPLGFNTPAS